MSRPLQSSITLTLLADFENLTLTGSAAIVGTGNLANNLLTGNGAANLLIGLEGDDTLNGGGGADTLVGGGGNDTYVVDNSGDVVTELVGEGIDTVNASINWTLGANIENLTLTGSAAIGATGNELNNILTGNRGANVLDGGLGADSLAGGAGNDVYIVDDVGDVVTELVGQGFDEVRTTLASYTLGANVEALSFLGAGASAGTGNALDNRLAGGDGDDRLSGGVGNDTLIGGLGADTLIGGDGNDALYVDGSDALIDGGNGTDTVYIQDPAGMRLDLAAARVELAYGGSGADTLTAASATAGVLLSGGAGNDQLTGSAFADTLVGGDGADTLNGSGGADTLMGGAGNDAYVVDTEGVVAVEAVGEGADTVLTSLSAYTLGANLENLTHTGGNDFSGTGNALDNVLTGGAGNDTLDGAGGSDILIGGAGLDTAVFGGRAYDAVLTPTADGWIVSGAGGTVTLIGIEKLRFDDRTINLDGVNNAPLIDRPLSQATNEDAAPLDVDLLQGARDVDGQPLSVTSLTQTGGDAAIFTQAGTGFRMDPTQFGALTAGETATVTLAFQVSDGTDTTAQTLTVTVEGRNDAPVVAAPLAVATDDNAAALTIDLLAGANDVDHGAALSVVDLAQSDGTPATVVRNGNVLTLDPTQFAALKTGDVASLTFQYGVSDGIATTAQTLTVTVAGHDDPTLLVGTGGADSLIGGTAADTLIGAAGADTLTGGDGADVFRFLQPDDGVDTITDFQAGLDRIEVVGEAFGLPVGPLGAGQFALDAPASEETRFVFDTATSVLSYDPDGTGSQAAIPLATFDGRSLSANDILVARL